MAIEGSTGMAFELHVVTLKWRSYVELLPALCRRDLKLLLPNRFVLQQRLTVYGPYLFPTLILVKWYH
jgi:hypothetical protein